MELTRPYWLVLLPLALVPLLRRRSGRIRFSSLQVVPDDPASRFLDRLERGLQALWIGLVVLGLSGPRFEGLSSVRWRRGTRLVFVVDQSASMFAPWRGRSRNPPKLDVAHRAIASFLEAFPGGRWALIGFGRAPVVYTSGTSDPGRFLQILRLQRADFGDTVIDAAMARALVLGGDFSAVVLLSDGAGRMESPEALAHRFREAQKRVYWLVIEGAEAPESGMERFMAALGPWGETLRATTVSELHRALQVIGLREMRPMPVPGSRGMDGTRLCYAGAVGILLVLGLFLPRPVWTLRGRP
jgi:hypothetical protein